MYRSLVKPTFDRLVAFAALILLSPLFLGIAVAIYIGGGRPIFFVQERLGRYGKVFRIYKFRSMNNHIVSPLGTSKLCESDPRITKVGKVIRKTSIDELPQLINILLGDMSFIGPRPPVPYFPKQIEEYTEYEYQRFHVKPGISGLAQVRCREVHDWEINIPIDVEYVQKYSFYYDLKLFVKSLATFFKTDNIYSSDRCNSI